uniref:Transmembrane anterior posterior transformation 1 n=1 Tax=Pipistrellus kuhlii TaxID=59472 RepID=A0A7J8B5N5_PIPKU|nr:transmembrane anterior posterior transformation 1 [Pipistrellus kuhlii]
MAGVGSDAGLAAGGRGGADGPERDGGAAAEQPGGGHGPPPAPQRTETLGFYESDRRRERRRGRAAHVFWDLPVPGCVSVRVHPAPVKGVPGTVQALHSAVLWLTGQAFAAARPGV